MRRAPWKKPCKKVAGAGKPQRSVLQLEMAQVASSDSAHHCRTALPAAEITHGCSGTNCGGGSRLDYKVFRTLRSKAPGACFRGFPPPRKLSHRPEP